MSVHPLADEGAPEITALPDGISLTDVIAALAQQSSARRAHVPPTEDELTVIAAAPFTTDLLTSDAQPQTNANTLYCLFCHTTIIRPNVATRHTAPIALHKLSSNSADRETVADSWLVPGHLHFENIAVTRPVPQTSASPSSAPPDDRAYKYLACATCDRGPIGITYLDQPNEFFVAHGRVAYE